MTYFAIAILDSSGDVSVFSTSEYELKNIPEFDTTVVSIEPHDTRGSFRAVLIDGSQEIWGYGSCSGVSTVFFKKA